MSQKIYCTVDSCAFNASERQECTLKSIKVAPCKNCQKGTPEEESFCDSYKKD